MTGRGNARSVSFSKFPMSNKNEINLSKRYYFVVGTHYSGISWVGNILSFANKSSFRDEQILVPSASMYRKKGFINDSFGLKSKDDFWFRYIDDQLFPDAFSLVQNNLNYKFDFLDSLELIDKHNLLYELDANTFDAVFFCIRKKLAWEFFKSDNSKNVFISEVGIFSSEWFSSRFKSKVVIVIRNPLSFVQSLLNHGHKYDFKAITNQKKLMKTYLSDYADDLYNPPSYNDIVGQGILLWNINYSVALKLLKKHPDWISIKLEDLNNNPIKEFYKLYRKLDLSFDKRIYSKIIDFSTDKKISTPDGFDNNKRNSSKMNNRWRTLEDKTITRVIDGTEKVFSQYYDIGEYT